MFTTLMIDSPWAVLIILSVPLAIVALIVAGIVLLVRNTASRRHG